jgi:hypothetical protein
MPIMHDCIQCRLKKGFPQGLVTAPLTYYILTTPFYIFQLAHCGPSSQEDNGYAPLQAGSLGQNGRGFKRTQEQAFYEATAFRGQDQRRPQNVAQGGYYGPAPPLPPPLMSLPSSSENALVEENKKLRRDLNRSATREHIAAQTLSAYALLASKGLEAPPQYELTLETEEARARDVLVNCWKQCLTAEIRTEALFMGKIIAAVNLLAAGFDGVVQSGLRLSQPVASFFVDGSASSLLGILHTKLSESDMDELTALISILMINMAKFLQAPIPANSLSPAPCAGISYDPIMRAKCENPGCMAPAVAPRPAAALTLRGMIKYLQETMEKLQATLPVAEAVPPPPEAVPEVVEDAFDQE